MKTKIFAPGNNESGYILVDVLLALIVISIGFGGIFGSLKIAVNYTVKREKLLIGSNDEKGLIAERNENVENFETIIHYK